MENVAMVDDEETQLARWAADLFARHARGEAVRILDTETTGLGDDAEVIEVAIVDLDGRVLVNTLVKPQDSIPADASVVNGLYDADLADAPALPAVWPQIAVALNGALVIAYNADFDSRMLRQSATRHELPLTTLEEPLCRWDCLMRACSPVYGEWGRWLSLARVCRILGVGVGGHRALGDALACVEVLKKLAAKVKKKGVQTPETTPGTVPHSLDDATWLPVPVDPPIEKVLIAEWRLDTVCERCHFPLRQIGTLGPHEGGVERTIKCPNCGQEYAFEAGW